MKFKHIWKQVTKYPETFHLYPLTTHWWLVIPTCQVTSTDSIEECSPKQIVDIAKELKQNTKLYPLLSAVYDKAALPQPVSLHDCMLINLSTETYCVLNQAITLYEDGVLSQFTLKD